MEEGREGGEVDRYTAIGLGHGGNSIRPPYKKMRHRSTLRVCGPAVTRPEAQELKADARASTECRVLVLVRAGLPKRWFDPCIRACVVVCTRITRRTRCTPPLVQTVCSPPYRIAPLR